MINAAGHSQPPPLKNGCSPAIVPARKQISFEAVLGGLLAIKIVVALVWLLVGQWLFGPGSAAVKPGPSNASAALPVISGAAGIIGQSMDFFRAQGLEAPPLSARVSSGFGLGLKEAWAQELPAPPPPAVNRPNPSPADRMPLGETLPVSGERDLNKRELALKARASALNSLEEDLNRKLNDLEAAKAEMAALVHRNEALLAEQKKLKEEQAKQDEQLKSARIEHLVTAYRSMKPEQAANLVNSMDDEIAVAILGAMPGRNAGMILAFVNPDKAARLTKAISERRLDPTLLLNQADNLPNP